jgi:hypothetical protein
LINSFTSSTASATFTPTAATDLSTTAQVIVTAANVHGDNAVTWDPVIQVSVPSQVVAGTYSGTIIHSVS